MGPWIGRSTADIMNHVSLLTGSGGRRQHDGLKPHREEIQYSEVTEGDQEIARSEEDGDFLFEQKWREDGLDSKFQLNDQEEEKKRDGSHEGRNNSHVIPLPKNFRTRIDDERSSLTGSCSL